MAGGRDPSNSPTGQIHEQYNGTAWTEVSRFKYSKKYISYGGAGTQPLLLLAGGSNITLLLHQVQQIL